MLENCAAGCTPDNQPCCCMGLHVCCTHSGKQCWFGRLATTTIASTSMTHLLLLWDEKRSQVGAVKRTCKGHTGRAMFSERSNKEACSMKAQGHVAHRRMQDGVARLPGTVEVFKHAHDTAPSACCQYALAKRCLVGTRSMS
jgi:hypothetical protein